MNILLLPVVVAIIVIYIAVRSSRKSSTSKTESKATSSPVASSQPSESAAILDVPESVKVILVKSKDTWIELECVVNGKSLLCEDGKEYPLVSLKKIIRVEKVGLIRKRNIVKHYFMQIMTGNSQALDVNIETGNFSEITDKEFIENAVAEGLRRAMERPSRWWEVLMWVLCGILGGIGIGLLLGLWFAPKPEIPPITINVPK